MERIITAAAIQMQMSRNIEDNIDKADRMVREAAKEGAQVILPISSFFLNCLKDRIFVRKDVMTIMPMQSLLRKMMR